MLRQLARFTNGCASTETQRLTFETAAHPARLAALSAACSVVETIIPEREPYPAGGRKRLPAPLANPHGSNDRQHPRDHADGAAR